jgi:hypothetical protein
VFGEVEAAHDTRVAVRPGKHERHCQAVSVSVLIVDDIRIVVALVVVVVDKGEDVVVISVTVAKSGAQR